MRRIRAGLVGLTVGVGLLVVGVASVAAADRHRPRDIQVRNGTEKVQGSQGNFCYAARNGPTLCGDFSYPLRVRGRLEVEPGERIRLKMHDKLIKRLSASLLEVEDDQISGAGRVRVERLEKRPQTWIAQIPADAEDANRISISVVYKDGRGDSNWWAGVKVVPPGG